MIMSTYEEAARSIQARESYLSPMPTYSCYLGD